MLVIAMLLALYGIGVAVEPTEATRSNETSLVVMKTYDVGRVKVILAVDHTETADSLDAGFEWLSKKIEGEK